jgi:hypothetical protein
MHGHNEFTLWLDDGQGLQPCSSHPWRTMKTLSGENATKPGGNEDTAHVTHEYLK